MSLIECPECGKQISDKAMACPGCGYPVSSKATENESTVSHSDRLNEIIENESTGSSSDQLTETTENESTGSFSDRLTADRNKRAASVAEEIKEVKVLNEAELLKYSEALKEAGVLRGADVRREPGVDSLARATKKESTRQDIDLTFMETMKGFKQVKELVCPHCQEHGFVIIRKTDKKKGISTAKASAAVVTLGFSVLATGLARKEKVTEAICKNCNSEWEF